MESVRVTDAQSQAVVKSPGTRVSLADIEASIAGEFYITGKTVAEAAPGQKIAPDYEVPLVFEHLRPLTICLLTMRNGFTIIGKAAPADPQNFDPELGRKFAREDAIRQVWPLMGYALRDKLQATVPA
jgi:hypothetical protein